MTDYSQEKKLNRIAWVFSSLVFLLVISMRSLKWETEIDFSFLPSIYSALNFITFWMLIYAFVLIRRKEVRKHRQMMTLSIIFSAIFLILYVLYHVTNEATPYCGEGIRRVLYFFLLITHVILAAVMLPFILFTYIRAYTNQFERHRRMARWVFPIWLYIVFTGPVIYWMLMPCK